MEEQAKISQEEKFPGEVGNLFDQLLRKTVELQKIPALLLAASLLLWALVLRGWYWPYALALWAFFLLDWLLLWLLPKTRRSFGPEKPIVVILAAMRAPFALLPPVPALAFQILGALLVVYGFWVEPHRLTLTRQRLFTPKLAAGDRFTVLHLGDLHIERITGRERRLNQMIAELKPDLILFSGDFLNLSYNEDPRAWEDCRRILQEWRAPLGVYAVTGSPAVDLEYVMPGLLRDLPLRWLQDEKVTLPIGAAAIDLIGLSCTHNPKVDGPRLASLARLNAPRSASLRLDTSIPSVGERITPPAEGVEGGEGESRPQIGLNAPLDTSLQSVGERITPPEPVEGGEGESRPQARLNAPLDRLGERITSLDRPGERFTILLHHTPDLAPDAAQNGMDLQLSGHTHGGQVRVPGYGAFFAASLYGKRFESGRYQLNGLTLYVTRGIGLEGQGAPRVRLFCPPEIILWEISGKS